MNISKKHIVLLSVAFLLIAIPAVAQIENGVTFDAPFAFYAGDAKMPAGSYRVTQPDANSGVLLLEDANGSHSKIVEFRPVDKDTAPSTTEVGFKKYGDVDFLSRISIAGENTELRVSQSKTEENAAKATAAEEHSVAATSGGTQPAASTEMQQAERK